MHEAIKNFNKQFLWQPEIINADNLGKYEKFVVAGMGGSRLAADIIKNWQPGLLIRVHHDYGLPFLGENSQNVLAIFSSYSGNTEETIDAFTEAGKNNWNRCVVARGGKLLELAEKEKVPYVRLPDTGIQPRSALGFGTRAFLKIMGREDLLLESEKLAERIKPENYEGEGRKLAERIKGFVPVVYSSDRNYTVSYNWKIKLNETGKIPAFFNVLPKLNHNEMTGFDVKDSTKDLSKFFYFIILKDGTDDSRVCRRMEVLEKMYKERGLRVEVINMAREDRLFSIFSSLLLADWTAYYTAVGYGVEPEAVPMVEEFKKLIL